MKNDIYWQNKEERARIATDKTNDREERFGADIDKSAENGHVFFGPFTKTVGKRDESPCDIIIDNTDSVSAVYKYAKYKNPVCVLNFASFLNPGGKFLEGSSAQEESLCMGSTLFNALRRFSGFYANRRGNSNNCLYTDESIYTPDIIFDRDNEIVKCDVITCAAVNASAARRWHKTSKEVTEIMMANRMRFVLDVAASMGVKTLILGAFGCGVFGNDPAFVADEFYGLLRDEQFRYDRFFDTVVFAIPTLKENDNTFNIFKDTFLL